MAGKGKGAKAAAKKRLEAQKLLADNRQARHQYEILETLETGIELLGTEVKAIRAGKANLRDGFCLIRQGQLQLHNVHIAGHEQASRYFNHEPLRVRRLLAHRRERQAAGARHQRLTGPSPRNRQGAPTTSVKSSNKTRKTFALLIMEATINFKSLL